MNKTTTFNNVSYIDGNNPLVFNVFQMKKKKISSVVEKSNIIDGTRKRKDLNYADNSQGHGVTKPITMYRKSRNAVEMRTK
jgi:hypothetical protein